MYVIFVGYIGSKYVVVIKIFSQIVTFIENKFRGIFYDFFFLQFEKFPYNVTGFFLFCIA